MNNNNNNKTSETKNQQITKKTILIELLFSDIHLCKCKTMNT